MKNDLVPDTPKYLHLLETGELGHRSQVLQGMLEECHLCPRECGVDRRSDDSGFCQSGYLPIVDTYCAHGGEEPVLSGTRGSGTIFFGHCNLRCIFCQNHQISQPAGSLRAAEVGIERLAGMMLELQSMGCHNINFVSPSHFAAQIVRAVEIAASNGLRIPLVYNSNAYDSISTLRLLDGIIDIYLPDLKYSDEKTALEYSKATDYVRHARAAILEMKQQVGDLVLDSNGVAIRGLLIRHLVLPNDLAGSGESLRFISEEAGRGTYISSMSQYYPTHKAGQYPLLSRSIRQREYERVLEYLEEFGLENGWVQDYSSKDYYCPDFDKEQPFSVE